MKIKETISLNGGLIDGSKAPPCFVVVEHTPVKRDKAFVFMFTRDDGRMVWKVWRPLPSKQGNHVSYTDYTNKETAQKVADRYNKRIKA